jgi:hypothetical protein
MQDGATTGDERQELSHVVIPPRCCHPATEKRPACNDRRTLLHGMRAAAQADAATSMELVPLAEQACNHDLRTGAFSTTCHELQLVPVLETGVLTYAAEDSMKAGQAYRAHIDLGARTLTYRMRGPKPEGIWEWCTKEIDLPLPESLRQAGAAALATTQTPMAMP